MTMSRIIPVPKAPEGALAEAIKSLEASVKRLDEHIQDVYTPRSASGKSQAKALMVALDLRGLGGRMTVEVWVKSSAAADFFVEGSADGINFRRLYTLAVAGSGGENHEGFMNAYPVIRARTETPNDNEIEVVAAR